MATFSTNQVRQLYVATASADAAPAAEGALYVNGDNGASACKEMFWLTHKGKGGVVKSDNILKANIKSIKGTNGTKMAKALNRALVSLNSVNSGAPINGQDYILRIAFRQFVGLSDEDQYFKYGEVKGTAGMTAAQFYSVLKDSIDKNFSNEDKVAPLIKAETFKSIKGTSNTGLTINFVSADAVSFAISSITAENEAVTVSSGAVSVALKTGATIGDVKRLVATSPIASALVVLEGDDATALSNTESAIAASSASVAGLIITAVEQPWRLGVFQQTFVQFTVQDVDIIASGQATKWADIRVAPIAGAVKNGKEIADLEYFCMGERGDIYRKMGFPNVIYTDYMVDSSKVYDAIDIEYFYAGGAEDIQKSPKTITIVVPQGVSGSEHTVVNEIIGKLEAVTNLTIADIL